MQEGIFVCLGSNCHDASVRLFAAKEHIVALKGVLLRSSSHVYKTEPQEYKKQPWFLNQVLSLALDKMWTPKTFLATLLTLEKKLGRVRDPHQERFGPRAIDMDLLLFGTIESRDESCLIPHPRMHKRAFVLLPLCEIAPDLLLHGKTLRCYLDQLAYRLEGDKIYQS
ncbi:MAG: 2-amino-4-hydroxy-6-hydroxymethyldihydropteridine diphosphokinase [Desulfovibrio sp.]|nr:2-amino-4-hydroxy-6-hydroxymethyldihydropteridine diphosphokinase [Desulfovibrio sp.]